MSVVKSTEESERCCGKRASRFVRYSTVYSFKLLCFLKNVVLSTLLSQNKMEYNLPKKTKQNFLEVIIKSPDLWSVFSQKEAGAIYLLFYYTFRK